MTKEIRKKSKIGNCPLCLNKDVVLKDSHIIPYSMYKELKGVNFNDKIISYSPNRRKIKVEASDYFYQKNL